MANSGFLTFSEALRSNCDGGGLEAVRRELWEKYKREIKAALVLDDAVEEKKASRAIYILWSYNWKLAFSQTTATGSQDADSWKPPPIEGDYCTRWEHVLEELKSNKQAKQDWVLTCEQKLADHELHPHMQDEQTHGYTVNEDLELVYPSDIATPAALTVARKHLVYYFEEGGFRTDASQKLDESCSKLLEEKRVLQDKLAVAMEIN